MIKEKIQQLLRQYPETRIVFFWDPDKNYYDEFKELKTDENIEAIEASEQYFTLKYQLEYELSEKKVFLYHPFEKPKGEDWETWPLLGLYYANKELGVDEVAVLMEEYKIPSAYKSLVKDYIQVLQHKTNKQKLAKILDAASFNEQNLKLGLVSLALDFSSVNDREQAMIKLLSLTLSPNKLNLAINRIRNFKVEDEVLRWFASRLDYEMPELSLDNLKKAAQTLKYNIILKPLANTVSEDTYANLKITSSASLNKMHALVNEWEASRYLSSSFKEVMETVASDIKEDKIIQWYGVECEYGFYFDKMLDAVLDDALERVQDNPQLIRDESATWKESPRLSDLYQKKFNLVFHASSMYSTLSLYSSFCFDSPEEYVQNYTSDLYKVDYHYRKASYFFNKMSESSETTDSTERVFEEVSNDYDRFLISLNVEWQKLLQDKKISFSEIQVPKQYDFYKSYIQDFEAKIAVIISDAFRYEAGFDLYENLLTDRKNQAEIDVNLASIPSDTKHGMTNLLPGKQFEIKEGDDEINYLVDGVSTSSLDNRREILKKAHPETDVVRLSEMIHWKEKEGRDFLKKNRRIYIYHDWIDAIGDTAKTEAGTFNAVAEAIDEIRKMMRKLNSWNLYHIHVTADHGFIYNQKKLTDSSRQDFPVADKQLKKHARFTVGHVFNKAEGYVFAMKDVSQFDTNLKVVVPKAINRYKKQGYAGVQFSHGGASLQELLIPVIKFYRKKQEVSEKVDFKRLDSQKRITTGNIKINLIQDQPVTNERKPREIIIGLYDEKGKKLSNEELVLFDSASDNPKERTRNVILTLNSESGGKNLAYLRAYDSEDKERLNPQVINEKLIISRVFDGSDFG
ncbi:MAG: BREX-1 system phosphatase PglZ type A [Bacteroidales bacterium]|nr:BREX-1 system phosphatase PglZ type A [Bacteroidales bacterium]